MPLPSSVAPLVARCKICGESAPLEGVVDFNKNCEMAQGRFPLRLSGIPIYYHRCPSCELLFTVAFDHFTVDDFKVSIYNDEYALVDPEYASARAGRLAELCKTLMPTGQGLSMLDYGCGNGRFAELMRREGYGGVHSYDPFVPEFASRPEGRFDFIHCAEVIEHSPNPRQTMEDMISMVKQPGIILISTMLLPKETEKWRVGWWYVSPRNGHLSILSDRTLKVLAESFGFKTASFNPGLHVMVKDIPAFAASWFRS